MPRRNSRGGVKASPRYSTSTPRARPRALPVSSRLSSPDDGASSPDPLDVISDAEDSPPRSTPAGGKSGHSSREYPIHAARSRSSSSVSVDVEDQAEVSTASEGRPSPGPVEAEEDEWAVFREEGDAFTSAIDPAPSREEEIAVITSQTPTHPFRLSPNRAIVMPSPGHDHTAPAPVGDSMDADSRDGLTETHDTMTGEAAQASPHHLPIPNDDPRAGADAEVEEGIKLDEQQEPPAPMKIVAVSSGAARTDEASLQLDGPDEDHPRNDSAEKVGVQSDQESLQANESMEPGHGSHFIGEGDMRISSLKVDGKAGEQVNGPETSTATSGANRAIGEDAAGDEGKNVDGAVRDEIAIRSEGVDVEQNTLGTSTAIAQHNGAERDDNNAPSAPAADSEEAMRDDVDMESHPVLATQAPDHVSAAADESKVMALPEIDAQTSITAAVADEGPLGTASVPASSPKADEEGEEELDEDTRLASEATTVYADDDVDMGDGSAAMAITHSEAVTKNTQRKSPTKKKPASKPKAKPVAKATVTAAAKKASKGGKSKAKVDDPKVGKAKASRATPESVNGTSVSIASAELAREDSPGSATDRVWCICRKRESEDDDDVMMVGCESCDDWFHPACISLTDDQVANLDVYICRSCERSTHQKTVYKKACKRDGCDKTLGARQSKYCSDLCAYKVMKAFADSISNKKTLKQISTTFTGYPKPAPVQIIHHATIDPAVANATTQADQLMVAVQSQMKALTSALDVVRKRQDILRRAIEHAESLAPIAIPVEETRASKSKRKGGGGPTEDKQCAWDPRLSWTDQQVMAEGGTVGREDDLAVCELAKRRCDKHSGWQKTLAISLEVEEKQLERQHQALVDQQEGLTKTAEVTKESGHMRNVFRERLTAKRRP